MVEVLFRFKWCYLLLRLKPESNKAKLLSRNIGLARRKRKTIVVSWGPDLQKWSRDDARALTTDSVVRVTQIGRPFTTCHQLNKFCKRFARTFGHSGAFGLSCTF
jgi:hypothetical protein